MDALVSNSTLKMSISGMDKRADMIIIAYSYMAYATYQTTVLSALHVLTHFIILLVINKMIIIFTFEMKRN